MLLENCMKTFNTVIPRWTKYILDFLLWFKKKINKYLGGLKFRSIVIVTVLLNISTILWWYLVRQSFTKVFFYYILNILKMYHKISSQFFINLIIDESKQLRNLTTLYYYFSPFFAFKNVNLFHYTWNVHLRLIKAIFVVVYSTKFDSYIMNLKNKTYFSFFIFLTFHEFLAFLG